LAAAQDEHNYKRHNNDDKHYDLCPSHHRNELRRFENFDWKRNGEWFASKLAGWNLFASSVRTGCWACVGKNRWIGLRYKQCITFDAEQFLNTDRIHFMSGFPKHTTNLGNTSRQLKQVGALCLKDTSTHAGSGHDTAARHYDEHSGRLHHSEQARRTGAAAV
jgi:hypothetical protein